MLQTQIVSTVALQDKTILRANLIAQRTGSLEIGLAKSLLIEQLKAKLASGVAHFIYAKKPNKDGIIELREAWGTTQSNITAAMTNGRGYNKELVNCIAYFDVIKGNWRSFRFENIYKVF